MRITRVGRFTLGWGESLVWDERISRLYFVDCAASTLHWLEDGKGDLHTLELPSMGAGMVLTENGKLVGALEDGLHVIDPDARSTYLLSAYPAELGGRANDACADLSGNLITGTLNIVKAPGSTWQFSLQHGWRLLDPDLSNTNGPTVAEFGRVMTLIVGDSAADYFSYRYDPVAGTVGPRSVFGDAQALPGVPDGATLDANDGLWCAFYGGGQLVRFTTSGQDQTVDLPLSYPADVTFGGSRLDRLYVVSVAASPDAGELDGSLLVVDDLGFRGRREPRFGSV
jgi:sugar lactone lactonase YvrE